MSRRRRESDTRNPNEGATELTPILPSEPESQLGGYSETPTDCLLVTSELGDPSVPGVLYQQGAYDWDVIPSSQALSFSRYNSEPSEVPDIQNDDVVRLEMVDDSGAALPVVVYSGDDDESASCEHLSIPKRVGLVVLGGLMLGSGTIVDGYNITNVASNVVGYDVNSRVVFIIDQFGGLVGNIPPVITAMFLVGGVIKLRLSRAAHERRDFTLTSHSQSGSDDLIPVVEDDHDHDHKHSCGDITFHIIVIGPPAAILGLAAWFDVLDIFWGGLAKAPLAAVIIGSIVIPLLETTGDTIVHTSYAVHLEDENNEECDCCYRAPTWCQRLGAIVKSFFYGVVDTFFRSIDLRSGRGWHDAWVKWGLLGHAFVALYAPDSLFRQVAFGGLVLRVILKIGVPTISTVFEGVSEASALDMYRQRNQLITIGRFASGGVIVSGILHSLEVVNGFMDFLRDVGVDTLELGLLGRLGVMAGTGVVFGYPMVRGLYVVMIAPTDQAAKLIMERVRRPRGYRNQRNAGGVLDIRPSDVPGAVREAGLFARIQGQGPSLPIALPDEARAEMEQAEQHQGHRGCPWSCTLL